MPLLLQCVPLPNADFHFTLNQMSKEQAVKGLLQKPLNFTTFVGIFQILKPNENVLKNKVTAFFFF